MKHIAHTSLRRRLHPAAAMLCLAAAAAEKQNVGPIPDTTDVTVTWHRIYQTQT
jgi:hypothetical protein